MYSFIHIEIAQQKCLLKICKYIYANQWVEELPTDLEDVFQMDLVDL